MLHLQQAPRDLPLVLYRRMRTHHLFRRMMSHQRLDLSRSWWRAFEEMVFRALHRCANCSQKAVCKQWLDRNPAQGYPSFCPNTHMMEACRIADPQTSPRGPTESPVGEPTLADVLAEPIVRQLMCADGVSAASLPPSVPPGS